MIHPRKSEPSRAAPPKRKRARFEIDRIVALRAALAVIVILFFYMILRVSMIAFGGSAAREVKHIERAVAGSVAREPAPAAATKQTDPAAR